MDSKFKSLQSEVFYNSSGPDNYKLGCLEQGLGDIMPWAMYEAPLATRREEISHKRARVEGSNNDIHNVKKSRNFNSCRNGQHGSIFPSKEDGMDKKNRQWYQSARRSGITSRYNSRIPSGS